MDPPEPTSPRRQFASLLFRLADLSSIDERRSFRAKAYRGALWSLDDLDPGLDQPEEEMRAVAGIGPGIVGLVQEWRRTGTLRRLERLEDNYPAEAENLLRLPGMTPRRLAELKRELGVETGAQLVAALDAGALASVRGLGPKTLDAWERFLELLEPRPGLPIFRASAFARQLSVHLERHLPSTAVRIGGSVRRLDEWVEEVAVLVLGADEGELTRFLRSSAVLVGAVNETADGGLETASLVGLRCRFRPGAPEREGWLWMEETGPPDHVAGLSRLLPDGEDGDEERVYAAAGLEWVPPPARSADLSPDVVRTSDLRGDFHVHTDWSPDGRMPVKRIAGISEGRYDYLAITDHAVNLGFGGLSEEQLAAQRVLIEGAGERVRLFQGAELNVGLDGSLDYDDEVLARLDVGVASVHSHFGLSLEEQTDRVMKALAHPAVDVLGHPTCRRIGIRPGIQLDLDRIFQAAAAHEVALEVNGHLDRLDLSADSIRRAAPYGTLFAANSDAHRVEEIGNVANAVGLLQRAGIPADRVINTWPLDRLLAWLGRRRPLSASSSPPPSPHPLPPRG